MNELIKLKSFPIETLKILLKDKTTQKNIIWATSSYEEYGADYFAEKQMTDISLIGLDSIVLQPRILKALEHQKERTRNHAEVFTPAWICDKMINYFDDEWNKTWQQYVDLKVLEITCGEAPYLVSRYDTSTGEIIDIKNRIGILDRKIRIVNENTDNEDDWFKWTIRAFQSVYGYEYQGDNLLIARINVLMTFIDYLAFKYNRQPTTPELNKIANIISWNIWQMDGLTGTVPLGEPEEEICQMSLFEDLQSEKTTPKSKIYNWRSSKSVTFKGENCMKFDFVIGNPPFQDLSIGDNKTFAPPVYYKFVDAAYEVADKVELIHPARFLFNAGSTPKQWNEKMLQDKHLKVMFYEQDSSKVFSNTDIKGGVAITYHDNNKNFGAIGIFTSYTELNSILKKVTKQDGFSTMKNIVITRTAYRLSSKMHEENPDAINQLSKGHAYDMASNIFERLPQIFFNEKPNDNNDYIRILGRENNERVYKFIRTDYVNEVENLYKYKVILAGANGNGSLGEILSSPLVEEPSTGTTETFISIGSFDNESEAQSCLKYVKTKFARILLGVLKITQANTPDKWLYVPMQDFTDKSDIDWTLSVKEIDKQLYKKYNLSDEEIEFIEEKAREME